MKLSSVFVSVFLFLVPAAVRATVFGSVRGIVHDPDHRPVEGARVVVKASNSDYSRTASTGTDGQFEATSIPATFKRVYSLEPR